MKVAEFAGEDDRRQFYGGDDDRRTRSVEYEFGAEWTLAADPAAAYALRWVQDTREIYVVRRPRPRMVVTDNPEMPAEWPLRLSNMDLGTQLLGWAENLGALELALDGWEEQMPEDDSLHWVQQRLARAAAETEAQRGPGAAGWWPNGSR